MSPVNKIDFGSVQVHKQAIAEIVAHAISEIDGVALIPKNPVYQFLEMVGYKTFPGIHVKVSEDEQISIEVKVCVRYGLNISDMARYVQSTIKSVIDKTIDINLKDINVNIQGVERGVQ